MPQTEPVSFGSNLRAVRTSAGLTQAELAELAGLSNNYISELESGAKTNPGLDTICALAVGLGVDPGNLVVCPTAEVA